MVNKNINTLFIEVDPSFTRLRSSRIASMIGTNGGYVDGDKATGVQGVWEIPKTEPYNSVW